MIAKWEIPSLIKLMDLKSGTVECLTFIKVDWVMPKVSCLSLEEEREEKEERLIRRMKKVLKKMVLSCIIQHFIKICLERQAVPSYHKVVANAKKYKFPWVEEK